MSSHNKTLEEIIKTGVKLTPMMEQYYGVKKNYPDTLLMFRMGDFYELFFEDAKLASKILNISLTHRGKLGDYPIPMSGIPHHAASTYIDRITSTGLKVAICEQLEDPKMAKGIVKRGISQIVSPGMPFDLEKSEKTENNFMGCAYKDQEDFYLVVIDYTTGDFFAEKLLNFDELLEKIQIYALKEFITYLGQWDEFPVLNEYLERLNILKTHLSIDYFEEKFSSLYIERLIPTYKRDEIINLNRAVIYPVGALSYYISSTQSLEEIKHLKPFKMLSSKIDMKITYPTLVGLELFPRNREAYKNSLLGFMDKTRTSLGARKLKAIFKAPLRDKKDILKRQKLISYFLEEKNALKDIREELFEIRDIERILAKLTSGKINGLDLINLGNAVKAYFKILDNHKKIPQEIFPVISHSERDELLKLSLKIIETLNDELGANLDKGNLIRFGVNKERDRLYKLAHNAASELVLLEKKYREETSIPNLRVKQNNVAGYFIEISKSHLEKVPLHFIRRQTLVNSERYQTEELSLFEKEILLSQDKLSKLEREIFLNLTSDVSKTVSKILKVSESIALLDAFQSLAFVAREDDFTKPLIEENKKIIHLESAWHPLIKESIKDQFVPHHITLDENKYFALITGPNMAGKTTVMREVAIIQFLAQLGSFVPAKVATVGLVDYIFSRLGAHDDIIRGQSTFMVEMSETAEILRHSTKNSLIILDEIGRGTSTYDGLSIAWSLVEHFEKEIRAITLFSTHYHELIDLVSSLKGAKNLTVKTVNTNGNVQFLYELIEEGAHQSFGLHVAKLAGLPQNILKRSEVILHELERNHNINKTLKKPSQLDLFPEKTQEKENPEIEKLLNDLKDIDPLNMTPMEALSRLHELKVEYTRLQ